MLLNDSYNHKEVNRKIIEAVGTPFGFMDRFKMGGIGSPRLQIFESSTEIDQLLRLDNNTKWCYVEMRPKGIIIRFRSLLDTYALVIPYWKLVLYKTDNEVYTIYKDQHFVRVGVTSKNEHHFIKKIQNEKAHQASDENLVDIQDY